MISPVGRAFRQVKAYLRKCRKSNRLRTRQTAPHSLKEVEIMLVALEGTACIAVIVLAGIGYSMTELHSL
jgi:hypothetical protein